MAFTVTPAVRGPGKVGRTTAHGKSRADVGIAVAAGRPVLLALYLGSFAGLAFSAGRAAWARTAAGSAADHALPASISAS